MNGRAPASADELVASGLLSRDELARVVTYGAGDTPVFSPGAAPRSAWGTPAALTPLIDLPAPATVTVTERDAYRIFVDGYERDWRANVGPFALRVAWTGGATGPVDVDLRLAPFSRDDGSAWAALAPSRRRRAPGERRAPPRARAPRSESAPPPSRAAGSASCWRPRCPGGPRPATGSATG